jgi:hypothetical protein
MGRRDERQQGFQMDRSAVPFGSGTQLLYPAQANPHPARVHALQVQATGSPYDKAKYARISKRRGKKRAIIAIARMILVAIYNMLLNGEAWNPMDLARVDMPQELHERQQKQAIKQAVNFLINLGIVLPEHVRLPVT